jgi:hypothetical protein
MGVKISASLRCVTAYRSMSPQARRIDGMASGKVLRVSG